MLNLNTAYDGPLNSTIFISFTLEFNIHSKTFQSQFFDLRKTEYFKYYFALINQSKRSSPDFDSNIQ